MTTKGSIQNEKALLHLTLETVNMSLRKVFRELTNCGPSCRKNVLKHLTELSLQLDGIEKKLSMGEWAKLKMTREKRHSSQKRRLSRGKRHHKRSSSSTKRRGRRR